MVHEYHVKLWKFRILVTLVKGGYFNFEIIRCCEIINKYLKGNLAGFGVQQVLIIVTVASLLVRPVRQGVRLRARMLAGSTL